MSSVETKSTQNSAHAIRALRGMLSACLLAMAIIVAPIAARAQDTILGRGDLVVTGFSGIKPNPAPLPQGANPLDQFFIDVEGTSAQILPMATIAPPQGQLLATAPKLRIRAAQVGQVNAIALDDGLDARTPSIYLGATSAYGLHIVLPDSDGDGMHERTQKGAASAQWMSGQFGPDAGPGAIWKIDGRGTATLFATLPANSGPGVGDIAFDRGSRQVFASSLDDGLIYRLSEIGQVIDSFDHGVAGRPSQNLEPVADDASQIDLANPAFDSQNPDTWAFTPRQRRVDGVAIKDGRLYYAVDGQVWSVGVSPAGFGGDARWELDAKGLAGDGPITDMLFDGQGRLYLAQRGAQRASYDYSVFAEPEKSSVVRYRREDPDDPSTKSTWVEDPETYAIGLPPEHNRAEGGIALGYAHDETGALRTDACGAMLWSTGHRLRPSGDDGETQEMDVHGLQGNDATFVRPQNTPPRQSYFVDYDDVFGDAAKSGHVGDVEIWQPCQGAPDYASAAPASGMFPPGFLPPGTGLPPEFPPPWIPPPGDDYQTNLKLKKRAMPKECGPFFGGWLCRYRVRVTNTGPDNYFGPIVIRDWLPAAPAGGAMAFNWPCIMNGSPTDNTCWKFGVFLAPTQHIDMWVYAWVPKTYDQCHLTNAARIEWAPPGSIWNSDPTDDIDFAGAIIPSPKCKGEKTDLKIYKEKVVDCFPHNGKLRCVYGVYVQNLGPGTYNNDIVIRDEIPNGTTATMAGAGWTLQCPNAGNTYDCTYPNANLAPTQGVGLWVAIDLTKAKAKQLGCQVKNEVEILKAVGGSSENTDPTNDTASAIANVPAHYCDPDETKTDLRIKKEGANGIDCFEWNGGIRCGYRIEVINNGPGPYNGLIEIEDTIPAGATAIFSGPAGWTLPCAQAGNVYTCQHPGANLPLVNDKVALNVRIDLPKALAKQLACKVRNDVRITKAPGGSNQNTNPGNDTASAMEIVPAHICEPSTIPESNLKITKIAPQNAVCEHAVGNWCRVFKLTVTNTGPDAFNGDIKVTDTPSTGAITSISGVGWTCAGNSCQTNAPVALQKNPPSADETAIHVTVGGSAAEAQAANCKLTNTATIVDPLGLPKNAIAADDSDQITVDLPAELCDKPVPETNLTLEKKVDDNGCLGGAAAVYHCYFNILVTNTGGNAFNDKIVVDDVIPAGTTAVFGAGWNCMGTTCTHPVVLLQPTERVVLSVQVNVPSNMALQMGCQVLNRASLSYPAGGSDQNSDATDDQGQDTAPLPARLCYTHSEPPPPPQCPPGFTWNGERCDRPDPTCRKGWTPTPVAGKCCPRGESWNPRTKQCGGDDTPPPPECPTGMTLTSVPGKCCPIGKPWNPQTKQCGSDDDDTPPPSGCKPGWTPTPIAGKCCPRGKPWNPRAKQCGGDDDDTPPPTVCPSGMIGIPPNCKLPPGPTCNKTARCLNGLSWSFDKCACVCSGNRAMKHGQCVGDDPKCPKGMIGTPPNCKPKQCPPGMVGFYPRCKKDPGDPPKVCPPGTRGHYPRCTKIVDPPKVCPPGTRGHYPRCKKIVVPTKHCPAGTIGKFPRCRPIVKPCPPGTFGHPPRCRRINLVKPPRGPGLRVPGGRPPRVMIRPGFAPRGFGPRGIRR